MNGVAQARRAALAALLGFGFAPLAWAQAAAPPAFNLAVGDRVWMTTADGQRLNGRVAGLGPSGIDLMANDRHLASAASDVRRIEKSSLRGGTMKGAEDWLDHGAAFGLVVGVGVNAEAALSAMALRRPLVWRPASVRRMEPGSTDVRPPFREAPTEELARIRASRRAEWEFRAPNPLCPPMNLSQPGDVGR